MLHLRKENGGAEEDAAKPGSPGREARDVEMPAGEKDLDGTPGVGSVTAKTATPHTPSVAVKVAKMGATFNVANPCEGPVDIEGPLGLFRKTMAELWVKHILLSRVIISARPDPQDLHPEPRLVAFPDTFL